MIDRAHSRALAFEVGVQLRMRRRLGLDLKPHETSYYLSRRALRPATRSEMPRWQSRVFVWLARHASDASRYFRIPTDRAIEIGTQITI